MKEDVAQYKIGRKSRIKEYIRKYKNPLAFSVLLVGVFVAWRVHTVRQRVQQENKQIIEYLGHIQYFMEKKEYSKALEGEPGIYEGLKGLNEKPIQNKIYSSLIKLYTAIIYKERKQYKKALVFLGTIQLEDFFMQAMVKCFEGDLHCELANYDQALDAYLKASKIKPNKFFTPRYLMKAALIYEKQKRYGEAIGCYQEIMDKYPFGRQHVYVQKQMARLICLKNKLK